MSNIRLLISRYLDGELAEDEVARLTAMLETDAAAVDALVFSSFIHAQLLHWMDQESDQAYVADTLKGGHESSFETSRWPAKSSFGHADTVALNRPDQSFITRARRRLFSFSFIATTLFIAGSISAVAYVIASRPVIVGQLTDAINCRWDTAPAGIQTGTLLKNDQDLVLLQGSAVITFMVLAGGSGRSASFANRVWPESKSTSSADLAATTGGALRALMAAAFSG
jgi:hypothetical protein